MKQMKQMMNLSVSSVSFNSNQFFIEKRFNKKLRKNILTIYTIKFTFNFTF